MTIATLKKFVKKNSKAEAAVIMGIKDTYTISNWFARNEIPKIHKDKIKKLRTHIVQVVEKKSKKND